jgi:uncharacterized protein YlxW (UPF0749 family)
MSLLADLAAGAIDQGYAAAARRRRLDKPTPSSQRPRSGRPAVIMVGLVLALAGALFATSAVATHRGAAQAKRDRQELVNQINARTAAADQYQQQLDKLRAQTDDAREHALSASDEGAALRAELARLEPITGARAVQGPGVRVVLDDAKDAGDSSLGVIYDRDIQAVVDALFASGAEAIAVNGARLTTQTAIREAGRAILVDYRPLAPPYDIDAIGPPDLRQKLLRTQTGVLYQNWRQVYGLGFSVQDEQRLTLPSATNQVLHYAKPLDTP